MAEKTGIIRIIIVLLLAALAVLPAPGMAAAEESGQDYTGLWYMGTTQAGSTFIIATDLVFNGDGTVDYVNDPDTHGSWEVESATGRIEDSVLHLRVASALGKTTIDMGYDAELQMYKATVLGLRYTVSRFNPIPELNVPVKQDAVPEDYQGDWRPYRLFVSGTEMAVGDVLADDLVLTITSEETGPGQPVPLVRIYQDVELEDRLEENVSAVFREDGAIIYEVYGDTSGTDGDVKYSGEIRYREDGELEMTMVYENIVTLVITWKQVV